MRSIEHDTLGEMALTWLAARCGSFRGACEVQIATGFVADAASISVMYHSEFRSRCNGWGLTAKTFTYEVAKNGSLNRNEKGDIPDYFGSVFEAKATRADFLSTFGGRDNKHANRLAPVAHLHWVVTEPGVCEPSEVPSFWGLLVRRGRGLSEKKRPAYLEMTRDAILELADRLLWKPARNTSLVLPCCPACNGPIESRRRTKWNAGTPAHLMDDDPNDELSEEMPKEIS